MMTQLYSPKEIIQSGLCIGCGSCVAQNDSSDVRMEFDEYGEIKPKGSAKWLSTKTESFSATCPFSPAAYNEDQLATELYPTAEKHHTGVGKFKAAHVGYVSDESFRMQGSSGGMVTWVATELLRRGLIDGVAHVVSVKDPQSAGHYFQYRISRTAAEIREGAKSRYHPIELSHVLKVINEVPGRYAVVGIPCLIKAVQLLRKEIPLYQERIPFTLALVCGHMKSMRFVESFAWQLNFPTKKIHEVEYRVKDPNRPAFFYTAMLASTNGERASRDWVKLADGDWGAGFFMNSACNFCDDVVGETADMSFGDAWVQPYSLDGRGTNVIVNRSEILGEIIAAGIDEGRLNLEEVDGDFVARTQQAGLKQRREGLMYRLTWAAKGVQPKKRYAPDNQHLTKGRKLIYRMRYLTSVWSHRVFWLARKMQLPKLYILWAKVSYKAYGKLSYHREKLAVALSGIQSFLCAVGFNLALFTGLKYFGNVDFNIKNSIEVSFLSVFAYTLLLCMLPVPLVLLLQRFIAKPAKAFGVICVLVLMALMALPFTLQNVAVPVKLTLMFFAMSSVYFVWRFFSNSIRKVSLMTI